MARYLKFILWTLPVLGVVLGYIYAFVFFHGWLEPWQWIGKPGENIVQIIGVSERHKLLVTTTSGNRYSFEFNTEAEEVQSSPYQWKKEEVDRVDSVTNQNWGPDFVSGFLPFQMAQLYIVEFLYKVEGKGEIKFALDTEGNLWVWRHRIAGLTGLVFYFYPAMGFLLGLVIILLIKGVNRLRKNRAAFHKKNAVRYFSRFCNNSVGFRQ